GVTAGCLPPSTDVWCCGFGRDWEKFTASVQVWIFNTGLPHASGPLVLLVNSWIWRQLGITEPCGVGGREIEYGAEDFTPTTTRRHIRNGMLSPLKFGQRHQIALRRCRPKAGPFNPRV